MLEGRTDLAVIWDVRIAPEMRRRGIAGELFATVERWARGRGCRQLKVETQNINVPACRFYRKMGCNIVHVDAHAYPELPGEVRILWSKSIAS